MTPTPLQVMKFASRLANGMGMRFIADFMAGKDVSDWKIPTGTAVDTSREIPGHVSFPDFCRLNPDDPERADGRKAHYGEGRQPLDDIKDVGWGPEFSAGNVLKYMRRLKQISDSRQKARWYWRDLNEMCQDDNNHPKDVRRKLESLLTEAEKGWLVMT